MNLEGLRRLLVAISSHEGNSERRNHIFLFETMLRSHWSVPRGFLPDHGGI